MDDDLGTVDVQRAEWLTQTGWALQWSVFQGHRVVNPSVRSQTQIYEGMLYGCKVVFLALSGHTGLPQTDAC